MTPAQIKALRAKMGITQRQLADLVQCGVDTVRQWEQGRRTPDLRYLPKLAQLALDARHRSPLHSPQPLAKAE